LANTLDLRRRIRSVKSTEQITKAMKMVAAARLRRAQARIVEARPYAIALDEVLRSVAARVPAHRHPLLDQREERAVTLVTITGDKGLCSERWPQVDVVIAGRKGIDFFRVRGIKPFATHPELMGNVTAERAFALARTLEERFTKEETDAVFLLSNRFRSIIRQEVSLYRLLPVPRAELEGDGGSTSYLFEPNPGALLDKLLPRHAEFQFLRALLSSQAAEQAARMTAMDAASKNAREMIDDLTLQYNRVRQASSTKEIIEIVSGAQALGER
jgi:F-type H+-transporting ATPase subunit gamma